MSISSPCMAGLVVPLLAALFTAPIVGAEDLLPDALTGPHLFADFDKKAKADRNISGITCRADRTCIVVADEMIAIQSVSLHIDGGFNTYDPGAHFGTLFRPYCKSVKKRKGCAEVDLEAIAGDEDDIFVSGSMGNASKSGNIAGKRWFLAKFAISGDGTAVPGTLMVQNQRKVLRTVFSQHPEIAPYVEKPLQCGGLNVEGLAVIDGQMFFGLRSPADRPQGEAMLVQSPVSLLSANKNSAVETTILHRLQFLDRNGKPLRRVGIRALEEVNRKILIATGPSGVGAPRSFDHLQDIRRKCVDVLDPGKNLNVANDQDTGPIIWIWDPANGDNPREIARLSGRFSKEKLEGLAVLGQPVDGTVDLILTIDSPDKVKPLAILHDVALQ